MCLPPLVKYASVDEYLKHYQRVYCHGRIYTFDEIRVYFHVDKFGHMFYESSARDGRKDVFSIVRAQRIDWIKYTLGHPKADLYQGWIKNARRHDPVRRVAVVYEQFVVVVSLWKKLDGSLKANFLTCYQADNSISKIRSSPKWSRSDYFHQINQSVSFMK